MYSFDALEVSSYQLSIKLEQLQTIENSLAYYEKVSILFLLYGYENAAKGFDLIMEFLSGNRFIETSFLIEWASTNDNWENVLRECLVIIQNFEVLYKLGIDYHDECLRFLPQQSDCSIYVHPMLKILFHMCEDIDSNKAKALIEDIRKSTKLPETWLFIEHLEIHLLHWIKLQFIKLGPWNGQTINFKDMPNTDVSILIKSLKSLKLLKYYNLLNDAKYSIGITERSSQGLKGDAPNLNSLVNRSYNQDQQLNKSEFYHINRDNIGICLIIDQKKFEENSFQEININQRLETRHGTEKDSKRLNDLFLSFGYRIIIKENLKDYEIIETVKKYAEEITVTESSYIVCILSHGQKDVVFGSNCLPVEINKINQIMRSKCMLNKPSILLVQACQTLPEHTATNEQHMASKSRSLPFLQDAEMPICDFLIYNSTVFGFASIRDKVEGSWFIQEFCEVLEKFGEERDLQELLNQINRNIKQKTCYYKNKKCIMIPEFRCSFTRKFILPCRKPKTTSK